MAMTIVISWSKLPKSLEPTVSTSTSTSMTLLSIPNMMSYSPSKSRPVPKIMLWLKITRSVTPESLGLVLLLLKTRGWFRMKQLIS